MKAYKGFNKDMTCRGFQYNEGGENETVADVVDEMRRFADRHWMHDEGQNVRLFADRIEKAVSSETPAARHNACCVSQTIHNAAAMREALENIAEYARTARCHTEDAHVLGYLDQIEKWAESALSAPPRNCDRFATLYDAVVAWGREDQGWIDWPDDDATDDNDLINILSGDQEHELLDWLFAPDVEKKGEDDEQK